MADYPAHQVPLEQSASWSTVSVQVGSIRWICLSGFHTRLSSPHAPDWLDLAAAGAELVKSSPVRQVYRVAWDDREYFVKIYRPAGIYGHIRRLLRPCPAQVEFGHLQIARSRSVPAVKPLAWGRRTTPGRAWAALITESIGPTESLDEILWREPPVPEDLRLEALAVAARLLGRLHCAGILHADLHPGNVLLKSAAAKGMDSEGGISERTAADRDETVGQTPLESEPQTACLLEAYISDLQTARFEPRGGHASADPFQRRRMRNAAVLYAGLRHRAGEQGLDHFLREYIRTMQPTRRGWPDDPVRLRRRLERLGDRHDRRVWAGRDRRVLRNSRFTRQIGLAGGWRAYVYLQAKRPLTYSPASTMQISAQQWRVALAEPGRLIEPGRYLKQGSCHTVVARTLELAGRKLPVVAKHSRLRPGGRGLLQMLRTSRALRQWRMAHALLTRGLETAFPLAALEHVEWFLLRQSIYLSEEITASINLKIMILKDLLPKTLRDRRELIRSLAAMLARLRQRGFRHRDCKLANILIRQDTGQSPGYRPFLVDLDGLCLRRLPVGWCSHEGLVRLAASAAVLTDSGIRRSDLMRFFHGYLEALNSPLRYDRAARKVLWRTIARQVRRKLRRQRPPAAVGPAVASPAIAGPKGPGS